MPARPPAADAAAVSSGVRRRPADRRRIILDAAAANFSVHGYHATTLETIAESVGISVPALYRHFPTKHALFTETSRRLADAVRDAIAGVPDSPDDPRETLTALLRAIVSVTLSNRGAGLYRWQSQFLAVDDAEYVRLVVIGQHRRVRTALLAARELDGRAPLTKADADSVTAAAISAAGSPSTHRAPLPAKQVEAVLVPNIVHMTHRDVIPHASMAAEPDTSQPGGLAPASKRELILHQSIPLFAERGFRDVSIDDIAQCADIPASGVYRHYANKAAILETAFWRANDRMIAAIDDALARARTPEEAVSRLVTSYVDLCSGSTQLIGVYMAEIGNVSIEQQTSLRKQQRRNIDEWASWVVQARPELTLPQARFMVHAALSVAFDLCRVPQPTSPILLSALICEFLLGDGYDAARHSPTPSPDLR